MRLGCDAEYGRCRETSGSLRKTGDKETSVPNGTGLAFACRKPLHRAGLKAYWLAEGTTGLYYSARSQVDIA